MGKKLLVAIFLLAVLTTFGILFKNQISKNKVTTKEKNEPTPTIEFKQYSFDKVGITLSAPADMSVDGGVSQDNIFTMTIQRGKYPDQNYYQLYGVLQETTNPTFDTESVKKDLEAGAKDTYIGGVKAVQGQYKGERNNLVTYIFTNKGIFKLTTTPPSTQNESITNSILNTLTFTFANNPITPYPTTETTIQTILAKKYNKPISDVKVAVQKEVLGYAYGSVLFGQGGPGEGGMWLAVMGNNWEVVWDGNGNVDCNKMRQDYGFPDTILKPDLCN